MSAIATASSKPAAATPEAGSSGGAGLSLATYIRATALHKIVTVELVSGYRITGRLANFDPSTMNLQLDFMKNSEVLVRGSSLAVGGNVLDDETSSANDTPNDQQPTSDHWLSNPREFRYLQSLFVRGSSIKFIDLSSDVAHTLLATYPVS